MEAIFEIFINLFLTIFESINEFFTPVIGLVSEFAPKIISFTVSIVSFVVNVLMSFIEGIIDFLDFKWLKNLFKGGVGGGFGVR